MGVLTSGRSFYQKRRAFPERQQEIREKSRVRGWSIPILVRANSDRASWLRRICIRETAKWSAGFIGARSNLVIWTNLGSFDRLVFTSYAVRRCATGYPSWESKPVAPSSSKLTLRTRTVIWVEPLDHWDRSERLLKSCTSRRKTTFCWHLPRRILFPIDRRDPIYRLLHFGPIMGSSMKRWWNFSILLKLKEDLLFKFMNLKILHLVCDNLNHCSISFLTLKW